MFKCFTCDFTCHDNKILLLHVELSHKLLTEFSCEENNCCRIYQFFDSYEKHRLLKHANDLSSGETSAVFTIRPSRPVPRAPASRGPLCVTLKQSNV